MHAGPVCPIHGRVVRHLPKTQLRGPALQANLFFSILDKHKDASFYERLILIEKQFPGAAVLLHKKGVMPKVSKTNHY